MSQTQTGSAKKPERDPPSEQTFFYEMAPSLVQDPGGEWYLGFFVDGQRYRRLLRFKCTSEKEARLKENKPAGVNILFKGGEPLSIISVGPTDSEEKDLRCVEAVL